MSQGELRKTGIDILGDVPWGTHLCQFYQTKKDLLDILLPYFKAGLENNEFCLWITSKPLNQKEAKEAIEKTIPQFDRYLARGQIEIIPYSEWYLKDGSLNAERVLADWIDKLNEGLKMGFEGLRLTGNTFWLEKKHWKEFADYEERINAVIGKHRMIAICTYSLDRCGAFELIDVVRNHQFALIRRQGEWELMESSERKNTQEELQKERHDLGERVKELDCLYGISNLVEKPGITLEEILQGTVDLISPAWQYPKITCAGITLEHQMFHTRDYKETIWKQTAEITVQDTRVGTLEVYYVEERPKSYEGSFLKEERNLINAIAERLGKVIEHQQAQEAVREVHDQLEIRIEQRTKELAEANEELRIEVTERKKVEEVLRTAQETLEMLVKERTRELTKANKQLRIDLTERKNAEEEREKMQTQLFQAQKMEAIGVLVGGVAHDFNNLLMAIQGNTELLLGKFDEADPSSSNLKDIRLASKHGADLIRQLLLFSRKHPMHFKPLNINKTVENLLKMMKRLIGEDIAIETHLEPELWIVEADVVNVEQMLVNLVINARDAMPEGGILTIKTENVTLKEDGKVIPEAKHGRFICLSVQDTGVGMDEGTVERVFEPFFTTKKNGKGTGLGLSVAYGIVKKHKGWINIETRPGEGSTFKIYLPVSSKKLEDESEERTSLTELQGSGERILVVEDQEGVREFLSRALSENGYLATEARNAKEARDIFEEEKGNFDLIFCDVVLPDKSGLQLVSQLLSSKPGIPVLLSSGYVDEKSQRSLIHKRGFRFLQKPYSLVNLFQTIKETLQPE